MTRSHLLIFKRPVPGELPHPPAADAHMSYVEPKRNRSGRSTRWKRYTLRSLLVSVTMLCVGLAISDAPAKRRRRAVDAIQVLGGKVTFAQADIGGTSALRRWLPERYFDCDNVQTVDLSGTKANDTTLAEIEWLTRLKRLNLHGTQTTDVGLSHLRRLYALEELELRNTQITDAGLTHLASLTALRKLAMERTRITGEGLGDLHALTHLEELYMSHSYVTDDGLRNLKHFPNISVLFFGSDRITDAALAQVGELKALKDLGVNGTGVTDAGLVHLHSLTQPFILDLYGTRVTRAGILKLKGVLPKCSIYFYKDPIPANKVWTNPPYEHYE